MEFIETDNHIYNKEVVTDKVYRLDVSKKRTVYLIDRKGFQFTNSCGPYSEYSFTGMVTNAKNLEDAKERLIKWVKKGYDFKYNHE